MSVSRDQIAMCTIFDDADIEVWHGHDDITVRVMRAIVAGAKAEPALNALFDPAGPVAQGHASRCTWQLPSIPPTA